MFIKDDFYQLRFVVENPPVDDGDEEMPDKGKMMTRTKIQKMRTRGKRMSHMRVILRIATQLAKTRTKVSRM